MRTSLLASKWSPSLDSRAACAGRTDLDFMPDLYDEDGELRIPPEILDLCGTCPLGRDNSCRQWAIDNDAYGIWGGTSRYTRLKLTRRRERVHCPCCESDAILPSSNGEICVSCGTSWPT